MWNKKQRKADSEIRIEDIYFKMQQHTQETCANKHSALGNEKFKF